MAAIIRSKEIDHEIANMNSIKYLEQEFEGQLDTKNDTLGYLSDYLEQRLSDEDSGTSITILTNFILNKHVDVVAYSLGKLYFLFKDEKIHNLILGELKNLKFEEDELIHRYVEDSIESIAEEENAIEIMKLECNIFENISHKFGCYLNNAVNGIPHHFEDNFRVKIHKSRIALHLDNMIYTIEELMKQLESGAELHFDNDTISGSKPLKINEVSDNETNFNQLVYIYALTFRENGHIGHLISLLNDDSPEVRIMGVDGLLYVLKVLTEFHEEIPGAGILKDITNSFKIMPKISDSLKTGINSKILSRYGRQRIS